MSTTTTTTEGVPQWDKFYHFEVGHASPATTFWVTFSCLFVSAFFYALFARAGLETTGIVTCLVFCAFGGLMFTACIAELPSLIGPPGTSIIGVAWIVPVTILCIFNKQIVKKPLSQHMLLLVQAVGRPLGSVFLWEAALGNISWLFAYPAGFGDDVAGIVAIVLLAVFWKHERVPRWAVILEVVVGLVDFASAFCFGFTTSDPPTPQPVWPLDPFLGQKSQVNMFPIGMVPYFLVPTAIFCHGLSLWTMTLHEGDAPVVDDGCKLLTQQRDDMEVEAVGGEIELAQVPAASARAEPAKQ